MESIRDVLRDSRSRLSEEDRGAVIKLLWLLEQASKSAQREALSQIRPLLDVPGSERERFLAEVRSVNRYLLEETLKGIPQLIT